MYRVELLDKRPWNNDGANFDPNDVAFYVTQSAFWIGALDAYLSIRVYQDLIFKERLLLGGLALLPWVCVRIGTRYRSSLFLCPFLVTIASYIYNDMLVVNIVVLFYPSGSVNEDMIEFFDQMREYFGGQKDLEVVLNQALVAFSYFIKAFLIIILLFTLHLGNHYARADSQRLWDRLFMLVYPLVAIILTELQRTVTKTGFFFRLLLDTIGYPL